MNEPYIGAIVLFCGNFAPQGWALCNGQLLPISQYAALFSILGTFFGGNGTNNFALPDFRGRVPVHAGQGNGLSPYVIGQLAGTENVTLTINNLPSHSHQVACATAAPSRGGNNPSGNLPSLTANVGNSEVQIYNTTAAGTMAPTMIKATGNSLPVGIIQPYLCVNFIIALNGIFPSRN
ncbi:MAG TPA: tail fiber protein [Bryobacteraceae bacterium]|nr:tail fiber protein [Bryobacteraceae bacterium]